MNKQFYSTKEAADQLGLARDALLMWLSRNPEYRPPLQMGESALVWTADDIENVRRGRAETRKRTKAT